MSINDLFERQDNHLSVAEGIELGQKRNALAQKILRQVMADYPEKKLVDIRRALLGAASAISNHIYEDAVAKIEKPVKDFLDSPLLSEHEEQ